MNKLHFLNKLLNGIEIKWIALGKATKYEQPTSYLVASKNYDNEHKTPVLTAGKTFILGYTDEKVGIYKASDKPVIIFDDFTTANKWVDFDFKVKSSAIKMITSSDDSKFLLKYIYYWLNSLPDTSDQSDHKRQWIGNYANKLVPIPCPDNPEKSLAIQNKIVGILDKFTELTAELTAELTTRKKQYEYYRNQLLGQKNNNIQWLQLGKLAENLDSMRKPITSNSRESGKYPYYGASGIIDYINDYIFDGDFLLVSEDGANLMARNTPIAFSISGKNWVNNHAHVLKFKTYFEQKYVEYYLNNISLKPYLTGAAQPKLTKSSLENLIIPNPPIEEKIRIVTILDNFEILTNSITEGLPHEIALREKQYEYYRDLLFSFPKPQEVA